MIAPDLLTRADVRVSRKYGWVTDKKYDSIVGSVGEDTNHMGRKLWRAYADDVSAWSWTREGAVQKVLDLHNMQEKARAYDLLARCSLRNTPAARGLAS